MIFLMTFSAFLMPFRKISAILSDENRFKRKVRSVFVLLFPTLPTSSLITTKNQRKISKKEW